MDVALAVAQAKADLEDIWQGLDKVRLSLAYYNVYNICTKSTVIERATVCNRFVEVSRPFIQSKALSRSVFEGRLHRVLIMCDPLVRSHPDLRTRLQHLRDAFVQMSIDQYRAYFSALSPFLPSELIVCIIREMTL